MLAADDNRPALAEARTRTGHLSNVDIRWMQLPEQWPTEEKFDLIVLHQVGYRLDLAAWAALATAARNSLARDATVLACHHRHEFAERILDTQTLHGIPRQRPRPAPPDPGHRRRLRHRRLDEPLGPAALLTGGGSVRSVPDGCWPSSIAQPAPCARWISSLSTGPITCGKPPSWMAMLNRSDVTPTVGRPDPASCARSG